MRQQQLALTSRQRELYDYLHSRINGGEGSPSLRKAAEDLKISHTAVASLLQSLQEKGWIRREGRYSRDIALLAPDFPETASGGRNVPIIGRVAAGLPLYAQQEWAGNVLVDAAIYQRQQPLRPAGAGRFDAEGRDLRGRSRYLRAPAVRRQWRDRGRPDQQ
jgi:repressor LexA